MRLKSLYIKDYKNIHEQTFDFSSNDGYIALIGLNGSGKSNLLEAIGLIYNNILNKADIEFEYELQYEYDGKIYLRTSTARKIDGKRAKEADMIYPSSIIACYSGEDLRLWHSVFENYYMHYFKNAIDGKLITPHFIYINKYCWEIALIALLCRSEEKDVNKFLCSCLKIDDISNVKISFTYDKTKIKGFKNHDAIKWFNRIVSYGETEVNAKTLASTEILSLPDSLKEQNKSKIIFQFLYLLSQPKKNEMNKVDKLITDISIRINDIDFVDLSEGEKKLILIECITKVLGDSRALILLDEPDAHTHIARKRDLLEAVASFDGQTILTTHSPMFANLMAVNNLFPMDRGVLLSNEKRSLIQKLANNEINIIDGACIVSSKNILITEGPDDIFHIKSAISAFSSKDQKYKSLENISFIFMGGAKEVDNYYNEILKSLYDSVNKIVFAFDYDSEGRQGARMVQKLIEKGFNKFQYVYYHKTYPVPEPKLDFYLEDFFDRSVYGDVQLPSINGTPSYAQLKKASTFANSIKEKIQQHKKDNTLKYSDYNGFEVFIDELMKSFGF